MEEKSYKLINENGEEYLGNVPGTLGGNKRLKYMEDLIVPLQINGLQKAIMLKIGFSF